MPLVRPDPVDIAYEGKRSRTCLVALARAAAKCYRRTPVVITVGPLCPPVIVGRTGRWVETLNVKAGFGGRQRRHQGKDYTYLFETRRVLIGPLYLAMLLRTPIMPSAPVYMHCDWWEEQHWIEGPDRETIFHLCKVLPSDVTLQREMLGSLGTQWPAAGPRPFHLSQARPL